MKMPMPDRPSMAPPLNLDIAILVVDDDAAVRQTVREYLESFGYTQIFSVGCVRDAVEMMRTQPIGFVISDWQMPGVSGLDFLKSIRGNESTRDLPFIIITSPISHENLKIEEAGLADVDAYLIKPFRADALRSKIAEVLHEIKMRSRRGVLIVDDDTHVRSNVAEVLDSMGFSPVIEAEDGEKAFELLKARSFEIALVISDWEMPKLEGIGLLKKIRIDRELSNTPFLMITSQTSIEHLKIQKALQADVDHYLIKPFGNQDLREKVNYVIEKAKLEHSIEVLMKRAERAANEGEYFIAKQTYQRVTQIRKNHIEAYLGLAHVKLLQSPRRGFDEAVQIIRTALKLNPKSDIAYIALAKAFETAGSLEKSIRQIKDGIKMCPPSEKLHYELGRVYEKYGRIDEAIDELTKAVDLWPEYEEARKLLYETYIRKEKALKG